MPVDFDKLVIGRSYERPYLARLWGYRGFQAISRGVVTPANTNLIILFVTEEKQQSLTQYNDRLDGPFLHWEGEAKHSSDTRVIRASAAGDEIHLFHRKMHHSPFTYMGQIVLEQHNRLKDVPSQFIFTLPRQNEIRDEPGEWTSFGGIEWLDVPETEKNAIVKSRKGQGVYRDGLLRLWGGCAVTGYKRPSLLLASHIKPWADSDNRERLDPYNGLLLQPTIDRLFDRGLISFDRKGKVIRASNITTDEMLWLGLDPKSELRMTPDSTMRYLDYHRKYKFERTESWVAKRDG